MASKPCDSCKSGAATLFCRADSAFLCLSCDSKIHAANKLASRHARVVVCEVCEQCPAHVTCKADAASLCITCDRDIHSANPVAQKHERVPVVPFYDAVPSHVPNLDSIGLFTKHGNNDNISTNTSLFFPKVEDDVSREEEEEAASWLLPNPKDVADVDSPDVNSGHYLFGDVDPYLDVDYGTVEAKLEAREQNNSGTDGVVPVQSSGGVHGQFVGESGFDVEFNGGMAKGYAYGYLSHSVTSSSADVGVVPDGSTVSEISNPYGRSSLSGGGGAVALSTVDREARVMRYKEKRKNRKFEKTIRYASRKAYAETRPRIKGRFAKRSDIEAEADRIFGFGVVPSF